jgi:hypothetical protein
MPTPQEIAGRRVRRFGREIAQDVSLHHGEAAALVEVRDGDAGLGAVDQVLGDDRALETELRIERDFARLVHGIADDLDVRGRIAANGGERALAAPRTNPVIISNSVMI